MVWDSSLSPFFFGSYLVFILNVFFSFFSLALFARAHRHFGVFGIWIIVLELMSRSWPLLSDFLYKSISFIFVIATRFKYFYSDILFIFISTFVLFYAIWQFWLASSLAFMYKHLFLFASNFIRIENYEQISTCFFLKMFNFWNVVMVNMSKKKELTIERKQNDIQMMRMAMIKTHVSLRTVRPQPYPPEICEKKITTTKWK